MTTSGANQDEEKSAEALKRAQARADRLNWMNNPEAVHSMADVAEDATEGSTRPGSSFCLTEGESVIASKTTAKAEAEARELAWEEAIVGTGQIPGAALAGAMNTDELLSQWSGQKQAQKARGAALQDEILKRIRSEIDLELEQIRNQSYSSGNTSGYSLGSALILMARAFGKDPRQWLPAEKVSNLFIEAVLYSAGMDLPWGFDSIPDYAELKYILGEDKRFTRVFRRDKLRPNESAADFAKCHIEDGDIALWVSPEIRLSGLLERAEGGRHNILSAGCVDSPTGFVYTTLEFFASTYATKDPTPDVVYRLARLGRA
jgi:hypothetical protein